MKQYLDLLQNIMNNGVEKGDRTGTGTKSIFGTQMRFNLQEGFPLVTTKKIHFKSVVHELLWILKGDTNVKYLQDNGVKIWDSWADKNGDLGRIYGVQWRKWRGYGETDMEGQYFQYEIDQLKNAIDLIKNDPMSRRIIVAAWNPAELDKMALTPCHSWFQFNCRPMTLEQRLIHDGRSGSTGFLSSREFDELIEDLNKTNPPAPKYYLDCRLDIRSSDLPIGGPYNIASYALLTHMIAQVTNTIAGDFVWHGGDTHCYINQFEGVKTQLEREPYPLPQIKLNPDIKDIDDFKFEDIELVGYQYHPHIKMPVAV